MRMNNQNIIITNHARERLFERFINPEFLHATDEVKRNEYADQVIREMFAEAVYISDNGEGILFRAIDYKAELVVSNGSILTIIKIGERKCRKKKAVRRSRQYVLGLIKELKR